MDSQVFIMALAGILSTLVGAILGPQYIDRERRNRDHELRRQTARLDPYLSFATAVEQVQLDLDLMSGGVDLNHTDYLAHFRAMEYARSKLDILGSQSVRVWAYRCRIAISAMNRVIEQRDSRDHFRAKLHEARAEFVTYARAEAGLVGDIAPHPVKVDQDTALSHVIWLGLENEDEAIHEAIKMSTEEFTAW